jgi:hypothetical protein
VKALQLFGSSRCGHTPKIVRLNTGLEPRRSFVQISFAATFNRDLKRVEWRYSNHYRVAINTSGTTVAAALAAAGESVLQARLTDRTYALVCVTPGHAERAELSTYVPGTAPLR